MNNLKRLRKEKGMSQADLATMLGVKQNTISGWEKGVREPSLHMLVRLASLFGCTVDALISNIEGGAV